MSTRRQSLSFEKATALDPTSDDAFRGLAEAYRKLNKPAEAEATYRKAISLRPQYWAGYSWLGLFYWQQGRYDDAAKMFREVVALAPDNFRGYSDLGAMHILEGRYPDAIAALEKSVSLRPTAEAYNNLGTTYFSMREFDKAAANFEEGLKLEKNNWLSWGNLGDAYYWVPRKATTSGNAYREALRLVEEKLRMRPARWSQPGLSCDIPGDAGPKATGIESLFRALSVSPKDPDVQFRAALVYNHFGDTDRTLQRLQVTVASGVPVSLLAGHAETSTICALIRDFRLYYAALSSEGALRNRSPSGLAQS